MTWLLVTVTGHLCHRWPWICSTHALVVNTFRSFPHPWLITGFVTGVTRRVPLMEQELPTLPEHEFTHGLRVTRSLVLCVMLCRSLFVLLSFFFLPLWLSVLLRSIYGFRLPLGIFKLFFVIYPCVRFNIEKQMSLF
jgi:hypothetical protein